mmetsp:Transcript_48310/g.105160  ORF Transcript_48310/g.105160 Transcript_48310/m.105160 type:complete len:228 (-) Transcript_48310:1399-2082(-)
MVADQPGCEAALGEDQLLIFKVSPLRHHIRGGDGVLLHHLANHLQAVGFPDGILVLVVALSDVSEGLSGILKHQEICVQIKHLNQWADHSQVKRLPTVLLLLRQQREHTDGVKPDEGVVTGEKVDKGLNSTKLANSCPHCIFVGQIPKDSCGLLHHSLVLRLQLTNQQAHSPRLTDGKAVLLGLSQAQQGAQGILNGGDKGGELQHAEEEWHTPCLSDGAFDVLNSR